MAQQTLKIVPPEGLEGHPGYLTIPAEDYDPALHQLLEGEVAPERPSPASAPAVAADPQLAEHAAADSEAPALRGQLAAANEHAAELEAERDKLAGDLRAAEELLKGGAQ